jgi:hypothetical protein
MKINNIKQLLSQVQTITNSYNRLSEANGDNFNIFSILKIESDEVRTHSRFIAEMLNPNGVHGFEDEFLKLFIKILGIETNIKTSNCEVTVEAYQGLINKEYTKGGSIDILIREKGSLENIIMIENKIYAGEQKNQLLRYYNVYPKGKLIFLTLFGDDSQENSSKKIDYISISYHNDIINWLEKCKMVAVDNPTLRETIKQYINLVKKLKNQNISKEMNEELLKLIVNNEENLKIATQISYVLNDCSQILTGKLDLIINEATYLKSKYEKYSIIKEIKLLPRFTYNQSQVIRIDLYFKDNSNNENYFVYQMEYIKNSYFLKTTFWGKGRFFEKIEKGENEFPKEIRSILYDESVSSVLEDIDINISKILDFLQND